MDLSEPVQNRYRQRLQPASETFFPRSHYSIDNVLVSLCGLRIPFGRPAGFRITIKACVKIS